MSPNVDPVIVSEVSSLVINELKCVSISSISLDMNISKNRSSCLLDVILRREKMEPKSSRRSYQVTKCIVKQETSQNDAEIRDKHCDSDSENTQELVTKSTVFKLIKEIQSANDVNKEDCLEKNDTTYAIAVLNYDDVEQKLSSNVESLHTAHERYMARVRDMVKDKSLHQQENCETSWDVILPSNPIQSILQHKITNGESKITEIIDESLSSKQSTEKSSYIGGPKKVTTAAAFFGTIKPRSTNTKDGTNEAVTKPSIFDKKANAKITGQNEVSHQSAQVDSTERLSQEKSISTKKSEASTEIQQRKNKCQKLSTTNDVKKVGNADDFVGDLDDEDESSKEDLDDHDVDMDDVDQTPMTRNAKTITKLPIENNEETIAMPDACDVDSDDHSLEQQSVRGAMDAFVFKNTLAVTAQESDGRNASKSCRRRKKLVEKTFSDAKGYLHTEIQEVWEDIGSDEEDNVKAVNDTTTTQSQEQSLGMSMKQQQINTGTKKDVSNPRQTTTTTKSKPLNKKSGNTAGNMKQGSLKGFFTKK